MSEFSSTHTPPRAVEVDAVLGPNGETISFRPSEESGESAGRARAGFSAGRVFSNARILTLSGLPWPARLGLSLFIPLILAFALAVMFFFVVGLGILRFLGGILGVFGFFSPRRPHRNPMDLLRRGS